MSDKKSFKIYKEWKKQFSALDNESAGELIKAILEYQTTGEVPEGMSPIVAMAFSFMEQQFERDDNSYEETSKARSEAGKKGGAPKGNSNASKKNQKQAKQAKTSKNKQNKLEEEVEVEEDIYNTHTNAHARGKYKNVYISDEDAEAFIAEYGQTRFDASVEILSDHISDKPDFVSNNHIVPLRGWIQDRLNENARKNQRRDKKTKDAEKAKAAGFDIEFDEIFEVP